MKLQETGADVCTIVWLVVSGKPLHYLEAPTEAWAWTADTVVVKQGKLNLIREYQPLTI